jgi:hypothetical protein
MRRAGRDEVSKGRAHMLGTSSSAKIRLHIECMIVKHIIFRRPTRPLTRTITTH